MSFALNKGQRQAASTLVGPVLVSAGAGTGKTRALTERFAHAVLPQRVAGWEAVAVDEILTITFTNKAAGELGERVRASLRVEGLTQQARAVDTAWISTIHGFCARLLRRHALEAGIDPAFAVADETAARELREEAFEMAAREMHGSSEEVRDLFARWGFDPVWGAVDAITLELETRGLTGNDIDIGGAPDVRGLLQEALALFRHSEIALAPHTAKSRGAANHVEACRGMIEQLEPLVASSGVGAEEIAARLWRALAGYSAAGGSAAAIKDICSDITTTRMRLLSEAVAVLTATPKQTIIELTSAYRTVLAHLRAERGVLDFADLQLQAVRLLEARPELRERYRRAFRLVMVDEFQDTDALQMRIVSAVAGTNLCTVGDERQSIYGFRGADIDVYRAHRCEMSEAGAHPVELTENYRSHPDVITFVNRVFGSEALFGAELLRLDARRQEAAPPLVSQETPRVMVDLVHCSRAKATLRRQAEAGVLAARLGELRDAGVNPGDMVVLVRRYASAPPVAAALRKAGFPVLVVGGGGFLDLPEVAMMRALCGVIVNPRDDRALAALLLSPLSSVSDDGVWLLRNAEGARETGHHLIDALAAAEALLEPADAAAATRLHATLKRARQRAGAMALGEVLMRAVEEAGLDVELLAGGDEGLQALSNVLRFTRKADAFEGSGRAGAAALVARVDAEARFGQRESSVAATEDATSAVRIMSMHAAKGLEFPVVALPMLNEQPSPDKGAVRTEMCDGRLEVELSLPSSVGGKAEHRRTLRFEEMRATCSQREAEEGKRVLYVACTRAREVLLLSGSENLEKPPDPDGASGLTRLRLALGDTLRAEPGTDEIRTIDGCTPVSVRIHEEADEADETGKSSKGDGEHSSEGR
ncbi:MAG: UvrD-helicase domain-containing protein, partial [Coriobacteriia bacterium]|nr:UvrD-helicase domain-containing protein [Coriobacteriia bacterium]